MLLASRKVIQKSLGFSPNQLVFGHCIQGPIAVLCDGALQEEPPESDSVYTWFPSTFSSGWGIGKRKIGKNPEKDVMLV